MTARTPLSSYQRRLILFLSVATFFEGFDYLALTQILPNLSAEMHLSQAAEGRLVAAIYIGPILAYLLVRQADRWGRRPVLAVTILGYTVCTLLSGLAPDVWTFGAAQLAARMFLIGEWAIAMVFAAEDFPADRRGLVIGLIQAFSSLGSVVCAGVVPLLLKTSLGWRSVFFVGALPLLVVAFLRRGLRESQRFSARVGERRIAPSFTRIWRTPWRRRVVELALIWGLTYVSTTTAVVFWKGFAVRERGFTDGKVGLSLTIASLVAMPFIFLVGRLLDVAGRRAGATVIFLLTAAGVFGSYTLRGWGPLTAALCLGIFGTSAVLPVLNAYTTELFPTELRGDAFAWSNNLLGRLGAVIAPLAVGAAAAETGWGPAMAATVVGPLVAMTLILVRLPETSGKELEETSALG